jgi:hypothetical protein
MPMLRITNGFDRLRDADLVVRANNIYKAMSGSTHFPSPQPTLASLHDLIETYIANVVKAEAGGTYDKAVKNEVRSQLITMLHALGVYVLFTAAGELLVAESSGFTIRKAPSSAPPVTAATDQKLEDGPNSGELQYSFKRVPGARGYVYEYTPDPVTDASVWHRQTGTVRKAYFTGLEIGKRYWFRVQAIGIKGQSVYSQPVSRIVQ